MCILAVDLFEHLNSSIVLVSIDTLIFTLEWPWPLNDWPWHVLHFYWRWHWNLQGTVLLKDLRKT